VATWRAKRFGSARSSPFVAGRTKPTRRTKGDIMVDSSPLAGLTYANRCGSVPSGTGGADRLRVAQ